jgi:hypothetical protein
LMKRKVEFGWKTMHRLDETGLAQSVGVVAVRIERFEVWRVMPEGEDGMATLDIFNEKLVFS